MSASTLPSTTSHCRERLSMVKTAKMELLRALISECLSAAAEEIFKIAERTIIEYEKEMSCSKWIVDGHRRLLDVAKSQSEGQSVRSLLFSNEITISDQIKLQRNVWGPKVSMTMTLHALGRTLLSAKWYCIHKHTF